MNIEASLVLNGDIANQKALQYLLTKTNKKIAVDGGIRLFRKLNLLPDLFIGDQDSAGREDLVFIKKNPIPTQKFPERKDSTDSELALASLLDTLRTTWDGHMDKPLIGLLAAFGNRYDHLLANQLMASKNVKSADFLLTDGLRWQFIFSSGNGRLKEIQLSDLPIPAFLYKENYVFSVLAMTQNVTELYIENAEYPLHDRTLKYGETIGVSNLAPDNKHPADSKVRIHFRDGCLSLFINPAE